MTPWQAWRFDALVEAARRKLWGLSYWEHDGWRSYLIERSAGVAFYLTPRRW